MTMRQLPLNQILRSTFWTRVDMDQPLFRLVLLRNTETPDRLYGASGSNYQYQRLKLGKQFADIEEGIEDYNLSLELA